MCTPETRGTVGTAEKVGSFELAVGSLPHIIARYEATANYAFTLCLFYAVLFALYSSRLPRTWFRLSLGYSIPRPPCAQQREGRSSAASTRWVNIRAIFTPMHLRHANSTPFYSPCKVRGCHAALAMTYFRFNHLNLRNIKPTHHHPPPNDSMTNDSMTIPLLTKHCQHFPQPKSRY